jgi:hypothetical protein
MAGDAQWLKTTSLVESSHRLFFLLFTSTE